VPEVDQNAPPLCHRCGRLLETGKGSFYVARIEAFADPTGPEITLDDLLKTTHESAAEWEETLAELSNLSEREMLDQVYRRVTILLCAGCYRRWIENPAGDAGSDD